jgi:hypothetical protein
LAILHILPPFHSRSLFLTTIGVGGDSDGLAGAGSASRVHLSLSASFRTSSPHRASFAFSTAKATVTGGLPKAAANLALFCSIFL